MTMDERRQHARRSVPTVTLRIGDAETFRRRHLKDLSNGGLFVRTSKTLAIGTLAEFRLEPPNHAPPILINGRVVRVDPPSQDESTAPGGMGVRFEDVPDDVAAQLKELIETYRAPPDASAEGVAPVAGEGEPERILRQRLAEASKQIEDLVEEIERFEGADASNRSVIAKLLEEQKRMADASQGSSQELGQLTTENTDLKTRLNEAKAEAERARKELSEFNADVAVVVSTAKAEASKREREAAQAREQLAASLKERDQLKDAFHETLASARLREASLQNDLKTAKERIVDLERQVQMQGQRTAQSEATEQALAAETARVRELTSELQQERRASEAERERARDLESHLKIANDRLAKARKREQDLRGLLLAAGSQAAGPPVDTEAPESAPAAEAPVSPPEEDDVDLDAGLDAIFVASRESTPARPEAPPSLHPASGVDLSPPVACQGESPSKEQATDPVVPSAALSAHAPGAGDDLPSLPSLPPTESSADFSDPFAGEGTRTGDQPAVGVHFPRDVDEESLGQLTVPALTEGVVPTPPRGVRLPESLPASVEATASLSPSSVDELEAILRSGASVERTAKFHSITSIDSEVAEMSALLERASTLADLEAIAPKKLRNRQVLMRLLYDFYRQGRISFVAGRAQPGDP